MLDKLTVQNGGDVNRCASSYNILGLGLSTYEAKKTKTTKQTKRKQMGQSR